MKNKDIIQLERALKEALRYKGANFAYKVVRNLKIISPICEAIRETARPSDEYMKYERERVEICEKYCKRDSNNIPIRSNNKYVFDNEQRLYFEKEVKELKEIYKTAIEERKRQEKECYELLQKECEKIELIKISKEELPDDITGEVLQGIEIILE